MPDSHSLFGPYNNLMIGLASLAAGLVSTLTGVTFARFGRIIYRAEEPKGFREAVRTYYVLSGCFVGYFLYKFYRL